ncbi:MAG: TRAP transporter substrate-binding protein [Rhodoferax sp.]|uniref:TRAP transporter substrate-binding protein n=1 Tax=Rhodoferax sp. TaxID=50421 RepID=UPI0008C49FBF|nr:TRAP transporter substrate-binding protein [Rhodoferax sp.]MDP2677939.1 TRAP transporter substrate-binding protein [Rhodoferax sp.]OGB59983.1 MAG: C4-dicarboxylate ABC transporter substrate-binding protein [Burkholderiales bacterium RIFOXYD12_FULL_59_19]OGB77494.1 MAG: C4-dicarboxylate ABC transporter substrate-binding protein [Burkholderiales bacterium RIFOXYC12_FULL_60_6]OGB86689.1 MAG: C4-dicarboxylate ABC transporter substrate-binding protein [Burkholderiales bacterium RIFOXYD2_FULL_59_8
MKLSKLFIGLSLAVGLVTTAAAQTNMKINIAIAQNSHQGVAIDTFAKEVEKGTAGRYKIQTFYNASLGSERESIESVQLGTQELTFTSTGPVPNFVPEAKILDIPFLFRDKGHARRVLDGPIGQEMLTKFDSKGFKALAWGENGMRNVTNNKRPVNTPDDLKGLKLRTMENPVHVAAYKGLGIVTTPMAMAEVFTALQQGTVDGQENPLSVIMAAKLDQVQKHVSLTGHVYSPAIFLMNKASFDKLTPADQKVFLEAAKTAVKVNRDRVDADDAMGVTYLRGKGMNVVETLDKSKFVATLAPVYAEFEKQFGKANMDKIRNTK